ncbi:MAG: ubiquinone/menaquinone biosynthesis methyltransferase [Opitutaceae bacterium]|nr:ubiquinone/menaquinone biosynthesis methyltransferase [Opitutaceae bacterium]
MPDPVAVNAMFGRIAGRYDLANRLLSGGLDVTWRWRLVREVNKVAPADLLDLATGSGDVVFALRKKLPAATRITGMDFCLPMLDEARRKAAAQGNPVNTSWAPGDLLDLPVADNSVDAITISFGLRNAADRGRALREMHRALRKSHGHLFVLEFSQPYRWFAPVYFFYLRHILPRVAAWCTGDRSAYEYLCGSIEAYPTRDAISAEIRAAGFSEVRAIPLTLGTVALHIARV